MKIKAEKKHIKSKILIIVLSLIVLLNGLGLIIAGRRTHKKSWIIWGLAYIVVEWVLIICDIWIPIVVILYYVSIVHTALICSEYGRLLSKKESSITEENNYLVEEKIDMQEIALDVGTATVLGESRDKLRIRVNMFNKGTYEFGTSGNAITSVKYNGKEYKYED